MVISSTLRVVVDPANRIGQTPPMIACGDLESLLDLGGI
jgi:hypothetical protein